MHRRVVSGIVFVVLVVGGFGSPFLPKTVLSSRVYSKEKATDFTLTDIYAEIFWLYNCSAMVVLINFFASWCPPCIQQVTPLRNIYGNYSRDQLEMISIAEEEESEDALRSFAEEHGIEWIVARDTINLFDLYDARATPTLFLIDVQRYIEYENVGLTDESTLKFEIESLLLKRIYVDDDNTFGPWDGTKDHPHQNITSGLEHASIGDIIYVYNGTYCEHVVINKMVSLIGENQKTTIIDGNGTGRVVTIYASNVTFRGFTLQGSGPYFPDCGVRILSSDYSTIENNIIVNNAEGIDLYNSNSTKIVNNTIVNSTDMDGIYLSRSVNNSIEGNIITGNREGIFLCESGNNTIVNNQITNNRYWGIEIWGLESNYNRIAGNIISNNGFAHLTGLDGIYIDLSDNNIIYNNIMEMNAGAGIFLSRSNDNLIQHNNFINNTVHVRLDNSFNNTLYNACEGNYWNDYNGTDLDNDGIGDTPYIIDEKNEDRYPLMNPYWNPADINHDLIVDMKDVYVMIQAFDSDPSRPNWNCHTDITGPEYLVPDEKVDMRDIYLAIINFGKAYP